MATKTIAWNSGSGYITLTYTGIGNAPISVSSDANDLFEDRQQTVQIATTNGSPQKAVSLLVKQKGKTYPVGTVFNYDYTGSVQQITLPKGKYKLQCWGAHGGNVSGSYTATGSKGGYSEGVLTITEPTTIYIFVGGQGTSSSTSSTSGTANGGWNGGGSSVRYSSYNSGDTYGESYPRPGGGATDMCLVTSSISYSSGRTVRSSDSLLSRFIVAGGGAGASAAYKEVTTEQTEWNPYYTDKTSDHYGPMNGYYYFSVAIPNVFAGEVYRISNYYNPSDTGTQKIMVFFYSGSTAKSNKTVSVNQEFEIPANIDSFRVDIFTNSTDKESIGATTATASVDKQTVNTSITTSSQNSQSTQRGGGTNGEGYYPGTQASAGNGGDFGLGANQNNTGYRYVAGAGGGGWYGGGTNKSDNSIGYVDHTGGGSGFVNIASNSSYIPSGYTGLQLDSGETIYGGKSFPAPSGGNETGHSGNGYARITVIE